MNELAIFSTIQFRHVKNIPNSLLPRRVEERSGAVHDAFLWAGIQITTVVTPARALLSGSPL